MDNVKFGDNQYCGPSVISAIVGITTDEAALVIQTFSKAKRVTGVYEHDLIDAFSSIGYSCKKILMNGKSVFSAMFSLQGQDGYYVFSVPGHYIAIEVNGNHRFICDNHTKEPLNISSSARLGQRVVSCFKVVKK